MPIKQYIDPFLRIQTRRLILGMLMLWLILSGTACTPDEAVSPAPALTLEARQGKIATIVAESESVPTKIMAQPAAPTAIPTALEVDIELPNEQTAVPTFLPTLSPPTLSPPTLLPPTISPQTTSTPTAVPLAATSTEVPVEIAAGTAELVSPSVYNIGQSSRGFPLTAFQFGNGPQRIVIVGAIHGGYEWNTTLLTYEAINYFLMHSEAVPDSVTLIFIPSANPDGQELVTGKTGPFFVADLAQDTEPGRFNGNGVDLNRNWDCNWAPEGTWRGRTVSGGDGPFSEPETRVLRDFLLQQNPVAAIFLHSAANGVFASSCPGTHQPSMDLAWIYGEASGYPVYESFTAYEVTGDAGDWLTTQGIPSISIELKNHQDLDFEQNLAGILAVLAQYR